MTLYAHDWSVLGDDRIRRWPSPDEPRGLRVEITTWIGTSLGAKHFYAKVKEEDNQWWSEEENTWVELSCDSEKGGYDLRADCMTRQEAEEVAKFFVHMIQRNNPDQKYDITKDFGEDTDEYDLEE